MATIKQCVLKNLASRKIKLLMEEKERIIKAINKSTLENAFILNNPVFLQKEVEEALKEAGYVSHTGVNGIKFCRETNFNLTFSDCFNQIVINRLVPFLKVEDGDDELPKNEANRYKKQKRIVEKAIEQSVDSLEDFQFRFQTVRIEFSLDFSCARLHKSIYDELEKAGFVIENSCVGIAPIYTAKFKTNF